VELNRPRRIAKEVVMRKYLWALALCSAAGTAVPGWAQERSKSLFGLGRSSKPETSPSEKSPPAVASAKAEKPKALKNYSELFGRDDQAKPADAPSPEAVQKMMADADRARAAAEAAEARSSTGRQDLLDSRTPAASAKRPVAVKKTNPAKKVLLDDMDELEALEEQAELEAELAELKAVTGKRTAPSKSVAARPAPPAEGRVSVRPALKAKTPVKTAPVAKEISAEQPAWASSSEDVEVFTADPEPVLTAEPAPAIKQVSTVATRPQPPATRPPATRAANSKIYTPISVATEFEEPVEAAAESTPVSAPPVKSVSRLSITRGNSRPAIAPESLSPDISELSNRFAPAKTPAAVTQTPTVTVEWRSSGAVTVGQESSCELIVKNAGSVTAQKVEIEATFPANVRLVSADPKPESSSKLVWEFEEILAGEEKVVHVRFIPIEGGAVDAAASVRFTGAASTSFAVTEPLLALKLEGPSEVMVGENASQTLVISNPGTGTAANVKVEAILPAGLEHAKGDRLLMDLGNLAPGENRPIRLALTATAGGRQVIEVHSTADNGLVQSAATEVSVIAPSLQASIEGPGLRYLGRNATYTLHVINDGAAATDSVRVMHKIPEGFEYISSDKGAQYDSATRMLNWFVGRLDRSEKAQLAVVLNAKTAGEFTHFIRASSEHGAVSDSEVTTRVEGAASLVVDVSDLDDPVEVGVETAYEITVKNEGTAPAANVGLTCELPTGMEFLTASGDSNHTHEADLIVFQPISEIAPGKTLSYRVKVKGTLSGNMRFRTKLSSDSLADPLASEEMTKIYGE